MNIRELVQEMNTLAQQAARGEDVRRGERGLRWAFEQLSKQLSAYGDELRNAVELERARADLKYYFDGCNNTLEKHNESVRATDSLINQISNFG